MNRFVLLLTWRYLFGRKEERSISTMILICFASILIGTFSLALVTVIMNGFEKATQERLRGLHAPIMIENNKDGFLNVEAINSVIQKEFPEIKAISPTNEQQIIIQDPDSGAVSTVVLLKGIDPVFEQKMETLNQKFVATLDMPNFDTASEEQKLVDLSRIIVNDHVVIGYKLANMLNLVPGNKITLLSPQEQKSQSRHISLTKHTATVGGIIKVGIDEIDNGLVLCSLDFLQTIFPSSGVSKINVLPYNIDNLNPLITRLKERFGLSIYTWQELYPALVAALLLEKYAMFFILTLITLVASMNIISLLFMYITNKRGDIAILYAMGMRHRDVKYVFIGIGMGISCIASILGLLFAFGAGYILEHYPFISLPDSYYVSYLPAHMEPHLFIVVFIVVMILTGIATWLPARKTGHINIAEVLRFEA
jgi:lipoprotein-releasing system permease protein